MTPDSTIVFDTETTGLLLPSSAAIEDQPRIIEIGAVKITGGDIEEFSQLIYPGVQISSKITKITGIKNEDLVGKPTFEDIVSDLCAFFEDSGKLICHNASFDLGMLELELKRCGFDGFPIPDDVICTVYEYMPEFGRRPTLKELYNKIIGKQLEQTHRALDDAVALHKLLLKDNFYDKIELTFISKNQNGEIK